MIDETSRTPRRELGAGLVLALLVTVLLGLADGIWGLSRHVPVWLVRTVCGGLGCGDRVLAVLGLLVWVVLLAVPASMWFLWRRRDPRFAVLLPGAVFVALLAFTATTSKDSRSLADYLGSQPGAAPYLHGIHVARWATVVLALGETALWFGRRYWPPAYMWVLQVAVLALPAVALLGALITVLFLS